MGLQRVRHYRATAKHFLLEFIDSTYTLPILSDSSNKPSPREGRYFTLEDTDVK